MIEQIALDKIDTIPCRVKIKIYVHTYYKYRVHVSSHFEACKEQTNDVKNKQGLIVHSSGFKLC